MVPSHAAGADAAAVSRRAPEWVVFACADHWFGVPLGAVREILPPQMLTRLPGCGPEVAGLVGLRGSVLTVFDLGAVLLDSPSIRVQKHRLLLIERDGRLVGAAVDAVIGTAHGEASELAVAGDTLRALAGAREEIVGVGALDDSPFLALDPGLLLNRLLS